MILPSRTGGYTTMAAVSRVNRTGRGWRMSLADFVAVSDGAPDLGSRRQPDGRIFKRRDRDGQERWWLAITGKGDKERLLPPRRS